MQHTNAYIGFYLFAIVYNAHTNVLFLLATYPTSTVLEFSFSFFQFYLKPHNFLKNEHLYHMKY